MQPDDLKALIEAGIEGAEVTAKGEGDHFDVIVVSDAFDGLMAVKKQQMVYKTVNDKITSGEIHALTIKAYTPAEWEKAKKLQVSL